LCAHSGIPNLSETLTLGEGTTQTGTNTDFGTWWKTNGTDFVPKPFPDYVNPQSYLPVNATAATAFPNFYFSTGK
jgi:hypothetical protein